MRTGVANSRDGGTHRGYARTNRRPSSQRSSQTSTATGFGDVPIFLKTREGLLERLAYYEARKLNNLPNSLLDSHDVLHGRETPDERRAREARATGRSR